MSRLEESVGAGMEVEGFVACATFMGPRPGHVFKRGKAGQGYYPDKIQQKKIDAKAQVGSKKVVPLDAVSLLERAESQHAALADAQVEVLDVRGMKKLVLSFEKKLRDNLEARMKHAADPDKFVDSELDLDEEIHKLHSLAAVPHLYPELVRLKVLPSVLGLLSHENTDIAAAALAVLRDLTDPDALEDSTQNGVTLVEALLEANALEVLVQGLSRFDEKHPEEAAAVFNTLGTLENMMEVKKEVGEQLMSRTKLLRWLLNRCKSREFDSNKFYAAELLSILMQGSEANQKRLGAMNGVDSLLQAVAMYKGREPASSDEEEMVANLFDAMCWVVMTPENKEKFVQAEGIELMLLVIKNKKYARLAAIKSLDFALTRCPAGCERFVEVLGLKSVFAALMGKIKATAKRKLTAEEKRDEEARATSLLGSLFMGLGRGSRRDRLGAKFVENEFEKIDRLLELFVKYDEEVAEAEKKFKADLGEGDEELDEEEEEELQAARMDAGLYTLQMVALILSHVWSFHHSGMRQRILQLLKQCNLPLAKVRWILQEHCDTIGDNDGVEERDKRQKRIQKLINGMYEAGEEPPSTNSAGDALGDTLPDEPNPTSFEPEAREQSKEKKKKKKKERSAHIDDIDMEIDWDMDAK